MQVPVEELELRLLSLRFKTALFEHCDSLIVVGQDLDLRVKRSGIISIMEKFHPGCEPAVKLCLDELADEVSRNTDTWSYLVFMSIFVDEPHVLQQSYELDPHWLHEICWEAHWNHKVATLARSATFRSASSWSRPN